MPEDHIDLVRKGIEAFNRGDWDATLELCADAHASHYRIVSPGEILVWMTKATRRTRFSRDAKVKRLAGVPLFSGCSKSDLTKIASLADELEVPEGKVLMRQGDRAHECFVILDGKAKVSMRGKRSTTLGAGDCVGELALLDPGARRSATVTAETGLDLLVLGSREFSSFLDDVPRVGRQVLSAAADRLRAAEGPRPHH